MTENEPMHRPRVPNKYRLLLKLGEGGMAVVYLAVVEGPNRFNKLQVVKRLRSTLASDPESRQMFLDEARLAARLQHPNIVLTNDVGHDGEAFYIAMEYLEGQTLHALVKRARTTGGELPLGLHLKILLETLKGLNHAHELTDYAGASLDLVHRDVSPQNIFVTYDGFVKLLDFGIAKTAASSTQTRTGVMKGKCSYMAPEQFGAQPVDRRADLFAVGVLLWQALTGQKLWRGLGAVDIWAKLRADEIPHPTTVRPECAPALSAVCMQALAVERSNRFETAEHFRREIERASGEDSVEIPCDLGIYVSEAFRDERRSTRDAIEGQLRPTFDVVDAPPASTESLLVPEPRASTREGTLKERGWVAVAGVASAAALLLSLMALRAPTTTVESLPAEPTQAPPSVTRGIDRPLPIVRFSVQTASRTAQIYLDGAWLGTGSVARELLADDAVHLLRVDALGYVSESKPIELRRSEVQVRLNLSREPLARRGEEASPPRAGAIGRGRATWVNPRRARELTVAAAVGRATGDGSSISLEAPALLRETPSAKASLDHADPWEDPLPYLSAAGARKP